MKRREVLKKLRKQAKEAGLEYTETELTNHLGVKIETPSPPSDATTK